MRSTQPPKMATWLLKQFGCSPNNDAVIGDLTEQYRQGKTSSWYWKQTLIAIVRSVFREIGGHKWLIFRAIAVGWMMLALFDFATHVQVIGHPYVLSFHPVLQFIVSILNLILMVASGWTVARISKSHHSAAVLLFAGSFLFYRSITGLSKMLLVYEYSSDPAHRSAFAVHTLTVFPLENCLLALLILKGGGLISISPTRQRTDV